MVDASLGDRYPDPPRILPHIEECVQAYLTDLLFPGGAPAGKLDLFATEGATAAMIYIFHSLKANRVLLQGDHIALATPIFSPYLDIPSLSDYQLTEILLETEDGLEALRIPDVEIAKLNDPRIKVLFMVNPTNPTSVSIAEESLRKIARLVLTERNDLIVITDAVYAALVDEHHDIMSEIPENTVCVFSFSKYFGATGWRLGAIITHENNVVDRLISRLPEKDQVSLAERYRIISHDPRSIRFIDRLAMDSRDIALAHTGGLSCPQQAMMCLFSLFGLMDENKAYKKEVQGLLLLRRTNLYKGLGIEMLGVSGGSNYYVLVDIPALAERLYGKVFQDYLMTNFTAQDFLFRLAGERLTLCLPGERFAASPWSIRISLANLDSDEYTEVGMNMRGVLEDFHRDETLKLSK